VLGVGRADERTLVALLDTGGAQLEQLGNQQVALVDRDIDGDAREARLVG